MDKKTQRSIWWPTRCVDGDKIRFEGKTYRVVSQSPSRQDSAKFKSRFYTFVIEIKAS